MKKNDIINLKITSITNEGMGVGRYENMAVFVPQTVPGDEISCHIVKVLSKYAYGIIDKLQVSGKDRITIDCPVFKQCGSCSLRHINYEAELKEKENWVKDAFVRLGGFSDINVSPILRSPLENGYRNKAQFPIEKNIFGFYAPRSHRVIDASNCKLHPKEFLDIAETFCKYADCDIRHLFIRKGFVTNEIMVCIVSKTENIKNKELIVKALTEKFSNIKSIILNINSKDTNVILGEKEIVLFGKSTIKDTLCGIDVELSAKSFYQVNHEGAELLYNTAKSLANFSGTENILDLYCGTGTIGLMMSDSVKTVTGIEVVPEAIANAKENAKRNNIKNANFICADASCAKGNFDVIILDPPRKGCTAETLEEVVKINPQRIVYISCNPSTCARDCKILSNNYAIEEVQPVDMFPRTNHVETVVLLSKKNVQSTQYISIGIDAEDYYRIKG